MEVRGGGAYTHTHTNIATYMLDRPRRFVCENTGPLFGQILSHASLVLLYLFSLSLAGTITIKTSGANFQQKNQMKQVREVI